MKKQQIIFLIAAILFINNSINAQLLVNGEYRSRFQSLHGWKVPVKSGTDAIFGFDQRTRINFDYQSSEFSTRFTLQDARVWGAEDIYNSTGVVGKSNALDIYEAWVDVKLSENSSLKVGRQEWNYDDMRILCYRNWWTSGLSYDGLLYKMNNKDIGVSLDFGLSYNTDGTNNGDISTNAYGDRLQTLDFLNIKKHLNSNSNITLMFSMAGRRDMSRTTPPLIVKGTQGLIFSWNQGKKATNGLAAKASFYYQHGTDLTRVADNSTYKKVSAYLLNSELEYRTKSKKLGIVAGLELISGNEATNTDQEYLDTEHSFDLLNSARFPYYGGNITYFIVPTSAKVGTKGGGLLDPYFKLNIIPAKGNIINFSVWFPNLNTNVFKENDIDGNPLYYDKSLGTNFDLCYTHKFSKQVIFKMGASYALVSDTKNHMVFGYEDASTKTLNTMGNNYFAWTMLIVKPTFFKSIAQ